MARFNSGGTDVIKTKIGFVACLALTSLAVGQAIPAPRIVELKSADRVTLKATYFAAAKPGPGVILYHQSNRARDSWADAAAQLAVAGVNVLTVDSRGHGQSGGVPNWKETKTWWPGDLDAAFEYLIAQPGVNRETIGIGSAGWLGAYNAVETARRHPAAVKSLVLLSGESSRTQLQFLHETPQLPALFAFSDEDEYPPTQQAMQLLYATSSSPAKKLVHYSAAEDAPWLWYETDDAGKVPAKGGHGTDMFKPHPELPGIIVHWFVTTLIKTPGHAPADPVAAAPILREVEFHDGVAHATQLLTDARKRDPQAQLWPEISMSIVGQDFMREGDARAAIEVLKLNLLAYPDSADANDTLADAYLQEGQKDIARELAQKALALLDSHTAPGSTWTDTQQYRKEIRKDAEKVLKQVGDEKP